MLILASKSPIRKTLLESAGLRFSVEGAPVDERACETDALTRGATREGVAAALARTKAMTVSETVPGAVVIGADQTLEFEGRGFNKPESMAEAAERLMDMAGKSHYLHSAAALVRDGSLVWEGTQSARLRLKPFSRPVLEAVLACEGEAILQSVGGYRLEGPSIRLFAAIEGDYFTVLGLPLLPLLSALEIHAPESFESA